MPDIQFSPDYIVWLSDLKQRISLAGQEASLTLNAALKELYWEIGSDIICATTCGTNPLRLENLDDFGYTVPEGRLNASARRQKEIT